MPCYTCSTCVCKVLTAANHIVHTVWLEMLVVVMFSSIDRNCLFTKFMD